MSVFDELKSRGLIAQATHEEETKKLLDNEKIAFYIGFDPTAASLTAGHFLQLVVASHMQKAGHKPILLLGGGTTMVGDPSGKTDMRRMLTQEQIQSNAENFKKQFSRIIDFSDDKAVMVNNSDWLLDLKYIPFLRDIGVHFSVNRMLAAECFKARLERGLSFLEFNYMLMQAYDFLVLNEKFDCKMQFGGDDQWSNIIAGVELLRRAKSTQVYGMTFTLLTTSTGMKMGKTEKGAVWLDETLTSPYEFYQYWRNVDDRDVLRFIKMLTFVPLEKVAEMEKWEGSQLNEAKRLLAYEITKIVHGDIEAQKAADTAASLFTSDGSGNADMPTTSITLDGEINILDLLIKINLAPSKSEARRLVEQGGIALNGEKVPTVSFPVKVDTFANKELIIKKGKKIYHKIKLT
ncbi:MAG: tyrosine--tRNA ligase [Clostridiales bacterium]|jgi:tyrosyl-tRNA synthetase|nr:tyrosine--tRNA ligase [Clostridiales bacterium]